MLPAYPQKKESQRVANAGKVITEILALPDNIPQDLIHEAECAIVLPGVLKFAIGLGGSYATWAGTLLERAAELPIRFAAPFVQVLLVAVAEGHAGERGVSGRRFQ